ncbi:MAG: efflux RND transporter periplasmic adaptor subunit [Nitrospira sp. BO4]|nr:efflux RND transporter periplasmic adaptor subunit [Nitrospira sp. BO4]
MATSRIVMGGLALAIALAAIAFVMLREEPPASSHTKQEIVPPSPLVSVQTLPVQRRDVMHSLTLPGNVSPWLQATLYAKVPGYLKWMGADKGDVVKKGKLLAILDAPEVEQQFQQAEADYHIKSVTFERLRNVWNDNPDVIAKQDVDVAEAAAKAAKYLRDSRKSMLDYTKVLAPFHGIITARFADPGAFIPAAVGSATQTVPLFTIMDLDTVRVYLSVPQEDALWAKDGIPAHLAVRELPGQEFRGTVTRTTTALDPSTRTLLVEIDLPNPDHRLRPGMFVTVTLILQEHPQALALPPAALVSDKAGTSVFVVENGKIKQVAVKTGLDDGTWIEVVEGLRDNIEVVVVGKSGLTDGQAVRTSPYNLPAGEPSSQQL